MHQRTVSALACETGPDSPSLAGPVSAWLACGWGNGVNELVRWKTADGAVIVEIDSREPGFQSISRSPGQIILDVKGSFDDALENVRNAAVSALKTFRDEVLDPDAVEIEFGVKFNAEAGAVIAKTSAEGHLLVKLSWSQSASD
jgi:hypothetical protein